MSPWHAADSIAAIAASNAAESYILSSGMRPSSAAIIPAVFHHDGPAGAFSEGRLPSLDRLAGLSHWPLPVSNGREGGGEGLAPTTRDEQDGNAAFRAGCHPQAQGSRTSSFSLSLVERQPQRLPLQPYDEARPVGVIPALGAMGGRGGRARGSETAARGGSIGGVTSIAAPSKHGDSLQSSHGRGSLVMPSTMGRGQGTEGSERALGRSAIRRQPNTAELVLRRPSALCNGLEAQKQMQGQQMQGQIQSNQELQPESPLPELRPSVSLPLLGTSPNHRRLRTGSVSRALAKNGFSSLLDTRPGHAVMLPREAADGAGHEEGVGSLVGERAQLRGARRG